MPEEYYKNMVLTHLHDTLTYEKIADITTTPNMMDVSHKFVSKYDNILTKMESRYITEFKASPSKFYCLPKVHKSEEIQRITDTSTSKYIKISRPPILSSRPICAGPNNTNKLSNLLDIILKPTATKVKSYVRDDFDFLNHVTRHIDFDSTLVTFDVTALYTNIPNDLALEAIGYWVDNFPESLIDTRFTKDFICEGILFWRIITLHSMENFIVYYVV